jgi:hypothetical protein
VDHLKGKVKNLENCLNNIIKTQLAIHSGNPDKSYKPRASRARKAKGGLSPNQDMEYEMDMNELEEDDNAEEHELLTKKRLRPRKEKVNYFDIDQGKK